MKRFFICCVIISLMWFIFPSVVSAAYVLPYPSYMPGNKIYRVTRIIDRLKQPFYFGNLSSYKYHLVLSDKYLVEAKTLFEYKQYLLAVDALSRSDREFSIAPDFLVHARKEGKDVHTFEIQFTEASQEHKRILQSLVGILPSSFEWRPEKSKASILSLGTLVEASIVLRDGGVSRLK